ncbi:GGDEF domain-containing protein [Salinisphaera sp. SPP-AMP-43]|uniref:GGDEF domain-containing protein n=1 Tax=Salinisphaera sp. SPP-AMP-43 TaxID=3121288 RepID=UPI003C6DFB2F
MPRPVPADTSLEDLASHDSTRWRNNGATEASEVDVNALRTQAAGGFRLLRFDANLEGRFRSYLRETGRTSRLTMLMLAVPALAFEPLVDHLWLSVPPGLISIMAGLDWLVMMPLLVATTVIVVWRNTSSLSDWMLVITMFGIAGAISVQRMVGVRYGFDVPIEMATAPLLAVLTLGRIPFWRMLLVALVFLFGLTSLELTIRPPPPSSHFHLYTVLVLAIVGLCAGYSLEYFMRWSWLNSSLLRYMARYDGLTGLLNRPALEARIEQAHEAAQREGRGYALALIDIDRFGEYNDHYGHQAGDTVLSEVGRLLSAETRAATDVCGRYGGEEFLVLWSDTTLEAARRRAWTLCECIAGRDIASAPRSEHAMVTASVGLCYVAPETAPEAVKDAIACADRMLYTAKADGRHRTCAVCFA